MLHNIGATSTDRSMTVDEISRWTALEPQKIIETLNSLIATHYVEVERKDEVEKYNITIDGIRKVLSMYS